MCGERLDFAYWIRLHLALEKAEATTSAFSISPRRQPLSTMWANKPPFFLLSAYKAPLALFYEQAVPLYLLRRKLAQKPSQRVVAASPQHSRFQQGSGDVPKPMLAHEGFKLARVHGAPVKGVL